MKYEAHEWATANALRQYIDQECHRIGSHDAHTKARLAINWVLENVVEPTIVPCTTSEQSKPNANTMQDYLVTANFHIKQTNIDAALNAARSQLGHCPHRITSVKEVTVKDIK